MYLLNYNQVFTFPVSVNQIYSRKTLDQKGQIKTININRLFEV